MAAHPPPMALSPDQLNDTDERVLDELHDGRVTPQHLAELLDVSRPYASERLKRLLEHGHVRRLASGLYQLADDPREDRDGEADLRARLQDALEDRDDAQAKAERLREELDDCQELLDDARERSGVDVDELRRAIEDAEAAAERGDGAGLQDALGRAKGAINDE